MRAKSNNVGEIALGAAKPIDTVEGMGDRREGQGPVLDSFLSDEGWLPASFTVVRYGRKKVTLNPNGFWFQLRLASLM